jgi:hypothetical protein
MRSLATGFAIAAAVLFTASPGSKIAAATWQPAATLAPAGQYSPIHPAACGGKDVHCPPGLHWVCERGQPCRCVAC